MRLIFQEPAPPLSGKAVINKIQDYLQYPFINYNNFKISILSLVIFAAVIFITLLVSRFIRSILDKRVLPRFSNIDRGLQYTMLRMVHYLIIFFGIIYALKAGFGADLTGIAVVIGFLSVGIGFGLQAITGDVIAGFILLFERPLRVGDYLKLGEMEGRVAQINLRSTMLITNDQVTIIVPNSELVKNRVINWSYSSKVRIKVPVETSEKSDLDAVTETLIRAASDIAHVLTEPKPIVRFIGHGDSSLKFELLIWTDAPHDHQRIRSDINRHIHQLFNETGIAIPVLQRDFHIRGGVVKLNKRKSKNHKAAQGGEIVEGIRLSSLEAKVKSEE
ncbi:MAG: mechanosensitive ion channel domain-containing protein [Acidobacteriota bacterium]